MGLGLGLGVAAMATLRSSGPNVANQTPVKEEPQPPPQPPAPYHQNQPQQPNLQAPFGQNPFDKPRTPPGVQTQAMDHPSPWIKESPFNTSVGGGGSNMMMGGGVPQSEPPRRPSGMDQQQQYGGSMPNVGVGAPINMPPQAPPTSLLDMNMANPMGMPMAGGQQQMAPQQGAAPPMGAPQSGDMAAFRPANIVRIKSQIDPNRLELELPDQIVGAVLRPTTLEEIRRFSGARVDISKRLNEATGMRGVLLTAAEPDSVRAGRLMIERAIGEEYTRRKPL